MSDEKTLKKWFEVSEDELHHRMEVQKKVHDKPLKNVAEFIDLALRKVLRTLGVDVTQEDVTQQQIALGIAIVERPPEEMGELSGVYVLAGEIPIAIIKDAFLANDGKAYLDIVWIQRRYTERFGGVRIIQ